MKREKGFVHIITGDGRGKTTSAFGLALRAVGHGLRVCIIQFMKAGWQKGQFGEVKATKGLPNLDVVQFGRARLLYKDDLTEVDLDLAKDGLKHARKIVEEGVHDLIILDEVCTAVHFGIFTSSELVSLIKAKPPHVELVLTGRRAPEELYEHVDYVSEIKEIKHPYRRGIIAREGFEY